MKFIVLAAVVALVIFFFVKQSSNKQAAIENASEGEAFLLENKANIDVVVTASGLQYEILQQGTGTINPSADSIVNVHYHGTLIDGSVFDSSVERGKPVSFPLNRVIAGWTEGVQLMVEGAKYRFFIPPHLAYGDKSAGKIGPGSTLIFEIELLGIN